jgi:hypothetical protein
MSQDWESYRFEQGKCLSCGQGLNAVTGPRGAPKAGSLMICAECNYVMEWDGGKLIELTEEVMREASEDPQVEKLIEVTRALRGLRAMPDRVIILEEREPEICADCGQLEELRPYGKKIAGKRQWVCFACAQKDPKNAEEAFAERMRGELPFDRQ